ncbi:MAG TPA: DUF3592 domain-containing protein [Thermoanaerobaculia bacterium]
MSLSRGLRLLSILTLAGALLGGAYRLFFLARAERTAGVVVDVWGENSKCGRGGHKDCTRFYATVRFQAAGAERSLRVRAGRLNRHNQPVGYAESQVGDSVPVLFDPGNPDRAVRDAFWDRWDDTLALLAFSGAFYMSSWARKEREEELMVNDTGEIISLGLDKPSRS